MQTRSLGIDLNDEPTNLQPVAEEQSATNGQTAAQLRPDNPVFILAGEIYERLRADATPDEALAAGAQTTHNFLQTMGLSDASHVPWSWIFRPIFDLPVGWSTPGADAEGAALASERFEAELSPTVVVIPDAETVLALPVIGHDESGSAVAGAMIAVPLVGDVTPDDNALVGAATGAGILGVQLENAMRARAARRALQLAQTASRTQRDLVEPSERREAIRRAMTHLQECETLRFGRALELIDGEFIELEAFGDPTPIATSAPGYAHIDSATLTASTSIRLPVQVEGVDEAYFELQSSYPLGAAERDTITSIGAAVAVSIVRARATQTIEHLRRSATRRLVEAQERERSMVAADIHDGVLQQLGATAIRLELAQSRVEQQDFTTASAIISDGAKEIRSCARELRSLLMELRPQVLDDAGLGAALAELGRHVEGVDVAVTADVPEDLGNEFAITIFRIVQEALTNIEKHAEATQATVHAIKHDDAVEIIVRDDGVGYERALTGPSSEGSHLGLLGMRERAQMFGGSFTIEGAKGGGTEVRVELPLGGVQPADPESY